MDEMGSYLGGIGCRLARRGGGFARLVVLAVGSAGSGLAQAPGVYVVDPGVSHIEIHVFRSGLLGGLGDNHVILLTRISGAAEASNGSSWSVTVRGETASLIVADPGESVATRQKVQTTMLGPAQLDAPRYPAIDVKSRSLVLDQTEKGWRMTAHVTLHGVTRQVEFPLAWTQDRDALRVQGKKQLLFQDFNIKPMRVAMGTIRVKDDFELIYDITLRKRP